MKTTGYQGHLRPWLPDIIRRIEGGEPASAIASDLTKQPTWRRLYPGEKICASSVMYAYERERKPWIWEPGPPQYSTTMVVPPLDELQRLLAPAHPGCYARAGLARIVDLPGDAPLRGRWLPRTYEFLPEATELTEEATKSR